MLTLLSQRDDSLHEGPVDDPDWTETLWLSFAVPERRLTAVTYLVLRPNTRVGSLGVWMWDDRARAEPDLLYFHSYPHLDAPEDIGDFELRCGFSQRVIEAGRRYEIAYDDGVELRLQLAFDALHEPVGREFGGAIAGSNQLGRVTGALEFNGQHVAVDCGEFRGRSWSSRGDQRMVLRPDATGGLMVHADTYAVTNDTSFFVSSMGDLTGTDVLSGYLLRDGSLEEIVTGRRSVVRHCVHGYPEHVVVEATDAVGRQFTASGACVNRLQLATVPGVPFPFWVCGTAWTVDGDPGWGQDQDVPLGRAAPHIAEVTEHDPAG